MHLEKPGHRDYRRGKNHTLQVQRNMKRLAETWMTDILDTFYYFNPDIKDIDTGDLTERLEFKKSCPGECSFAKDYLPRAYPQLGLPFNDNLAHGGLKCVGVPGFIVYSMEPWKFGLRVTRKFAAHEEIYLTMEGHLRATLNSFDIGVNASGHHVIAFTFYFNETVKRTQWLHKQGGLLQAMETDLCLHGIAAKDSSLTVSVCDPSDINQQWEFGKYSKRYRSLQMKDSVISNTPYLMKLSEYILR